MVEYNEWVGSVHEAYRENGGTYTEGTAPQLVQLASEFWSRNKDELKTVARREAVRIAAQMLARAL